MHRFASVLAARPLIGFSGRLASAGVSGGHAIVARSRRAVLAGLALLAFPGLGALSAPLGGAPETQFPESLPTSPREEAFASAPTWLEPFSAALALSGGGVEPASSQATVSEQAVEDAYAKLPLAFVKNAGQTDEQVRYHAQGQGFGFYFTPEKAVLSFTKGKRGAALQLTPLDASPKARLVAGHLAPSKVDYLVGAERHTNLPTYHELRYRELWPGIDMVFRGQGGKLKYEFQVAPGADPSRIRLAYRGAGGLALGRTGGLRIRTALGTLGDSRPRSYQRVGRGRVPVKSRYVLQEGASAYGFALGAAYDPRRALVIDPALVYSTFLGGTGPDRGNGIAIDSSGSAYVTGETQSLSFPTTVGAFDITFGPFSDAFVTKLNATGSALVYSTFLGGDEFDSGNAIAVDGSGSAYVTGLTGSSDFPMSSSAPDKTHSGFDAFVTKLNADGSALHFSSYLSGDAFDEGTDIAVDTSGRAYVTGLTGSSDFPITPAAFDRTFGGGLDAFVTKINSAGSAFAYSTFLGGSSVFRNDRGSGIAVDSNGSAYISGSTESSDFPTTAEAFDTTLGGFGDAFVTKLNVDGSALDYSTFLGGVTFVDDGTAIAVDSTGNAYVTGETGSSDFPTTPDAFDRTLSSGSVRTGDAFVTKLNAAGSALAYSSYLGGDNTDRGSGIAVDTSGNAYVIGLTLASDFPTTAGALARTRGGSWDAFSTKIDASGSTLAYSTFLGGASEDFGFGVAVDSTRNAYVTGQTGSSDFPITAGAYDITSNNGDAFVTKLNLNQCSDGRDNDGDAKVDFPADPGCSTASDDDESNPPLVPTSKDQCKHGGWRNYGTTFKNQGDCVSFVRHQAREECIFIRAAHGVPAFRVEYGDGTAAAHAMRTCVRQRSND